MRHFYLNTAIGMALGLSLSACDLSDVKDADAKTSEPQTEATVVGIWRTNVANTATNPPTEIKVTMQVDAAHTMLLSTRVATGAPSPNDYMELSKENWTWSVVDGKMLSEKTTCEYTDPGTMVKTTTCAPPLNKSADINVKAGAWTVVENGQPIVFRKD